MTINEANSYLFNENTINRFRLNLDILLAYGIVGYCEIKTITYPKILNETKPIVEWLSNNPNKEDEINWYPFFIEVAGKVNYSKFIEAITKYNMSMGWDKNYDEM